ncbi:MAG: Rieske 2Fe-2S domain-containing protein [Burkholderiaceae bacterium]|nr:Rieske 2Fe-2S domain-containing protein [Burkholderiaceae bacterium]
MSRTDRLNALASEALQACVDDRPQDGVFRIHSAVYTDPALFELEHRHIFAKTWALLGHVSQLPAAHDFLSTQIGNREVLVTRNGNGEINAFLNSCRHKGALLTRTKAGNCKFHVCPYHGWAYDSTGSNIDVKDRAAGCYTQAFAGENRDLIALPRVGIYKGLIFGSLDPRVPSLDEFLGETRVFLDLAMDQGESGMEIVPGRVAFRYRGNWKLQLENGTDFYHLTSTHAGFMDIMGKRRQGEGNQEARQFDWSKRLKQQGGTFQFAFGHAAVWLDQAEPEKRPIHPSIDAIARRVGDLRAEWMLKVRGISVFPNMQIADGASLTLRVFRPLAVDLTEVRYYCLAPVDEAPHLRTWRLRQFEDFFNVSGMATPDDAVLYEDCQKGFKTQDSWLQGCSRGMTAHRQGGNQHSEQLGFMPLGSVQGEFDMQNETTLHPAYREWMRLLTAGLEGRPAYE